MKKPSNYGARKTHYAISANDVACKTKKQSAMQALAVTSDWNAVSCWHCLRAKPSKVEESRVVSFSYNNNKRR